jgi:hypothetical protein
MNAIVEREKTGGVVSVSGSKVLRNRLMEAVGINSTHAYKTITAVFEYSNAKSLRAADTLDVVIRSIKAHCAANPGCTGHDAAKIARDWLRSQI